jgi:purine-nucleoside phosphorylase
MTPHISSEIGAIAPVVIMPGDPLRAKYIAEHYLTNYQLVNEVRGMYAYTGEYNGNKVTVMASGMGNPSMGIYSYELYKFYDVKKIIRIGTCGAYTDDLNLNDIILVDRVYSHSTYALVLDDTMDSVIDPSSDLIDIIKSKAQEENVNLHIGTIYNTDVFYSENTSFEMLRDHHQCLGVEMESFALAANAKHFNKECAILLTVSDSFVKKGELSSEEREKGLDQMIKLALESL